MLSTKTKQINVYGKRTKTRIIDATTENLDDNASKVIHRMKKRENNAPKSPPKVVGLTKQRVLPSVNKASPMKKKRGMLLAEILAEVGGGAPMTPSRKPLSALNSNALNPTIPLPSAKKLQRKITAGLKPKAKATSLVSTRRLSTVQLEIQVLDAKGQRVKEEKRTTRTDISVNDDVSNITGRYEAPLVTMRKKRAPIVEKPPVEVISIGSSIGTSFMEPQPQPEVISIDSSVVNDSQDASLKLRPVRPAHRKRAQVILISDEESSSEDDKDIVLPPSPAPIKSTRISLAPPAQTKTGPIARPRSNLIVEVVVPPPPYQLASSSTSKPKIASPLISHPAPKPIKETQQPPSPLLKPKAKPVQPQPQPHSPRPHKYSSQRSSTSTSTYTYTLPPSPPLKPRQLTPIRRRPGSGYSFGHSHSLGHGHAPPSPPSPTTPSDFDLSLTFSELQFDLEGGTSNSHLLDELGLGMKLKLEEEKVEYPEYLRGLLDECGQESCGPYEFSAFIETFPYDPILRDTNDNGKEKRGRGKEESLKFRKIGEASYSEVFGIGDVVLKVIPLRDESRNGYNNEEEEEGPAPTDAKDVRKEIIVTRAMGEVHDGFVELLKTYVVRGKYPEVLLNLWDEYNERKGSESVRPDTFTPSQLYAIIVLPNDGPDLETYAFNNSNKTGWRQACSLFWQVAKALGNAEKLVSFEHRDLHWGQILVKDVPPTTNTNTNKNNALRTLTNTNTTNINFHNINMKAKAKTKTYMDDSIHGVQATIIDLGLSRMDADKASVHWTPFEEEVFMGEGDYQFDIYRLMKKHMNGNWEAFKPLTNVMWLHYLATKLLHHKNLKPPSIPRKPRTTTTTTTRNTLQVDLSLRLTSSSSNNTYSEKDCYDSLLHIENWLNTYILSVISPPKSNKTKPQSRRKTIMPVSISIPPHTTSDITGGGGGDDGPNSAFDVVSYAAKRGWVEPIVIL